MVSYRRFVLAPSRLRVRQRSRPLAEPRMQSSTYFLNEAEECRHLAAAITARDDPAVASFLALAAEFEAKASESALREDTL